MTNLIPKMLDMVAEGKIAFTIAVELSQANRLKRMSQSGTIDMEQMFELLEQEKPNQREQIKILADSVADYFSEGYTPKQKVDLIEKLLKEWHEEQKHYRKSVLKEVKHGNSRVNLL